MNRATGAGRFTDSFLCLCIGLFALLHATNTWTGLRALSKVRLGILDAIFVASLALIWSYSLTLLNFYNARATVLQRAVALSKAVALSVVLLALHLRLVHRGKLSLSVLLMTGVIMFVYGLSRITLYQWWANRDVLISPRRVLILGSGRRAVKAWRELRIHHHRNCELVGFLDNREVREMAPDVASRYRGQVDGLSHLLLNEVVDFLVLAMPAQSCYAVMQQAVYIAEEAGVRVLYCKDSYSSRVPERDAEHTIFREHRPKQEHDFLRMAIKRTLDITAALAGLLLILPLILIIALAIKLDSKGPVFFSQERYGHYRRRFHMIKFRSMVPNAEALMEELEARNEASGPIFKMREDPRVTRVGRFLRTTSLDELPQLWNVLVGDMSLVGPRPMSVRDVALFDASVLMRRFSVKPGITGLWQVSGRSSVGFEKWIEFDFRYIESWSLLLDFKILIRTPFVVFRRSGAM